MNYKNISRINGKSYSSNRTVYNNIKKSTTNKDKQYINNNVGVQQQKHKLESPQKVSLFARLSNSIKQKMHERKIYKLGYKSFDLEDSRVLFRGGKESESQMAYKYFKKYKNLSPEDKSIFDNARLQAERDLEEDYIKISQKLRG